MFNHISKAGTGIILVLAPTLTWLLAQLGLEFLESDVIEILNALSILIGFMLTVIGQLDRKDLKYGLLRK